MNIVKHLFNSRGIKNSFSRAVAVSKRFGITSRKIESRLNTYVDITKEFGCMPTFPITAASLKRHPELIRKLRDKGVELAVHGYIHTDYAQLPLEEQIKHFERAIDIFKSCQIPFKGFRCPYLRWNGETLKAFNKLDFLYDSSQAMLWDIIGKNECRNQAWKAYKTLLDFYGPKNAKEYLVLPKFKSNFVEIPVSIPDDEALIDRLSIKDEDEIAKIWLMIFQQTYNRGELLTLQLHHERVLFWRDALETILQQARESNPSVWIATLKEIAEWWNEKNNFTFKIDQQGKGKYKINVKSLERATVLVRNCKVNKPTFDWANGYKSIDDRNFTIESSIKPFIGVKPGSSKEAIRFLRTEGFVVEESNHPNNYGIYFDNLADFEEKDEKRISEMIENSNVPLLRFWRWPNRAKSALAVTGDIDSITLVDFFLRLFGR